MKIIEEKDKLILDFLNPDYFKSQLEVSKSYSTESYWKNRGSNLFDLDYIVSYTAKKTGNGDFVVNYKRKLSLFCQIDDIEVAAKDVVKIKQEVNNSLAEHLKQGMSFYFELLNFQPLSFGEFDITRERSSLEISKKHFFEQKHI